MGARKVLCMLPLKKRFGFLLMDISFLKIGKQMCEEPFKVVMVRLLILLKGSSDSHLITKNYYFGI